MNIALIGYRGTGKSTIGKILAERLDFEYVEMDSEIEKLAGISIPEIVDHYSWDHFRDLESQVVETFTARNRQVLDTGGGVITRPQNRELLKKNALVFLLEANVEDIIKRISGDGARPSLTGTKTITEEVVDVLKERGPLYEETAHFRLNTSELSPGEIVLKIAEKAGLSAV